MKAQAESRQTLVLGVYAREFPGGLLKLDPAFAYAELLQYSCLENSMDRGTWQAAVHEVAESDRTED